MPFAHSYGWSPRYHGRIAHMVADCHYGTTGSGPNGTQGKYAAVLDNNPMDDFHPEQNQIFEWMDKSEMIRRGKLGQGGNFWLFAWLAPPPPPVPKVEK